MAGRVIRNSCNTTFCTREHAGTINTSERISLAFLCLAYLLKCPSNQVGGKKEGGGGGGGRWVTSENSFLYREADCPAREEYLFHWLQESFRYLKGP